MADSIADSLPSGVVHLDATGTIRMANSIFCEWAGIAISEIVGREFADLIESLPATDPRVQLQLPSLAFIAGPGQPDRPVLIDSTVAADGSAIVVLFDATTQRDFAEELTGRHALTRRTQTRLELVISASIAFAEAETETQLAEILAETTAQAFAAEEAVVYLLDDDNAFQQVAGSNPFGALEDVDSIAAQARSLRNVVKLSGVAEAYALAESVGRAFESSGVQAMVIAPIYQSGDPLGLLAVFFHHPRKFDEQASPLANALASQAARAVANLRLREQLQHAATHDEATGLPNRRLLEEHLEENLEQQHDFVAVIFIDLDGFKRVNDRLGHHTGDQLLREVAGRLQRAVREEDLVARFGGDEFVVVCQVASETAAYEVAERIRRELAEPYDFLPQELKVGASVGLSIDETHHVAGGADHLLRAADQAMYRAKAAGGNRLETELFSL